MMDGEVVYLLDDALVCNAFAGKYSFKLPPGKYQSLQILDESTVKLWGAGGVALIRDGVLSEENDLPGPARASLRLNDFIDKATGVSVVKNFEKFNYEGISLHRSDGSGNYYSSRRWLLDDHIIHLASEASGNAYIL